MGDYKLCSQCLIYRDKSLFSFKIKSRGSLQSKCKICIALNDKEYSKKRTYEGANVRRLRSVYNNRMKIYEYLLEHPCIDCGNTDWRVLQFDHIDDSKEFSITQKMTLSWEKMKLEIDKCNVRCANCHSLRTQERKNSWRMWWNDKIEKPELIISKTLKEQKEDRQRCAARLLLEGKTYQDIIEIVGIGYSTMSKWLLYDESFKRLLGENFQYESVLRRRSLEIAHCKNGHQFTEENTFISKDKNGRQSRVCKQCKKDRKKKYNDKKI